MQNDNKVDFKKIKESARAKASSACIKISAAFGISLVAVLVLLSRPLMAYFAREMCYSMHGQSSYWPNPVRGLWGSAWTTYQCEWMGHWGFNWGEVFSFLTNSWQAILTSLGSVTGGYALFRSLKGNVGASDSTQGQPLNDSLNEEQFNTLMRAIKTGYLPLHQEVRSRHSQTMPLKLHHESQEQDEDSQLGFGSPRQNTT